MLDSIREVFKSNLARLIGSEHGRLKEISVKAEVPYRTLQNALAGRIPQGAHLSRLAAALGVKETDLFVDLERFQERRAQEPQEALAVITRELAARAAQPASDPLAARVSRLGPEARQYVADLVQGLEDSPPSPEPGKGAAEKRK